MNYWYRMNLMENGKRGAFIHCGDGVPLSPIFENVNDLWKWIKTPECPYVYDEWEDGTFIPFRMKLKQ